MNKRIVFVTSTKGGPGKSTIARPLAELLRLTDRRIALYDADGDVGQLLEFLGQRDADNRLLVQQDPERGCGFFRLSDQLERDTVLNAVSLGSDVIVVDFPGGAINDIGYVVDEGRQPVELLSAYHHHGYRLTVVIPITPVMASIRAVGNALKLFQDPNDLEARVPNVDFVVMKNDFFADKDSDFGLFDGSEDDGYNLPMSVPKQRLLEQQGQVMCFPRLQTQTYMHVDRLSLSYLAALRDERLTLADRNRVRTWLLTMIQRLSGVMKLLGFPSKFEGERLINELAGVHPTMLDNPQKVSSVATHQQTPPSHEQKKKKPALAAT